jgi:hypothetical protein
MLGCSRAQDDIHGQSQQYVVPMLYFLAFLLLGLAAIFLLFRLVALAATEIVRVFLLLFVLVVPVSAFCFFTRRRNR